MQLFRIGHLIRRSLHILCTLVTMYLLFYKSQGDVEPKNKAYQPDAGAKSNAKNLPSTNNPSAERLPNKESSKNSAVPRQDQTSDGDSGYSRDTRSPKRDTTVSAPSDGSPSSDTLNSKASGWSSSRFHDCTDRQLDDTPAPCSIADIESVLQALQRARISLSAKLSKPVPPSQVTLALPAPGDEHREYDDDDLPTDDGSYGDEKLSGSSPACQEMLALPAPEDYHGHEREGSPLVSHVEKASTSSPPREEMLALPAPGDEYRNRKEAEDYMRIPAGIPGLFRLPVDSFPVDEKMFSGTACGSGFRLGLRAAARHATGILSSTAASCGVAASVPPSEQGIGLQASAMLSAPTSGRCISVPTPPDLTVGSAPFLSGIPGLQSLSRGIPLADADLFMQRGIDCTVSNKWTM